MRILVPTDFSDYAKDALVYAVELNKAYGGGNITLLNVFPHPNISPYVYDELISNVTNEIKSRTLNKLKAEWQNQTKDRIKKSDGITVDFKAEEGQTVDSILKTAKKSKSQMIVMGTKGAGKIKRFLFGTNASKVIEKSECPVITVPKLAKYKKINRILFTTDCNRHEVDSILDTINIAKVYGAHLDIVYVTDEDTGAALKALERVRKLVEDKTDYKKISYEPIISDDVTDAIEVYIQVKKINLLAVATKKRSLFNKIFDKNLAKELAFHLKVPLLAFHR